MPNTNDDETRRSHGGRQNPYSNNLQSQTSNQTQTGQGWNTYGCAGDHKCLLPSNKFWYRQPNGNKFCFTNYASIEFAREKCRQFNSMWAGSCTHIASYQMYTGEYRWEILNVNANTKCDKNFDLPSVQIDPIQYSRPVQGKSSPRSR